MIITRAICLVHDGKLDEATRAANELRSHTLGRKGALVYECFLDRERGAVITTEIYATSEDMLTHNETENFGPFMSAVTVESIELHGDPTSQLVAALSGFPVTFYPTLKSA